MFDYSACLFGIMTMLFSLYETIAKIGGSCRFRMSFSITIEWALSKMCESSKIDRRVSGLHCSVQADAYDQQDSPEALASSAFRRLMKQKHL